MRRAIVLANGEIGDVEALRSRLQCLDYDLSIAADGGSRHASVLGLSLGVVIGDLDSLDADQQAMLRSAGVHFEMAPVRKDETDLELALLYACQQGAEEIVILGALGGRLDMSLANILLLTHPRLASTRVVLWAGYQTAWIIRAPGDSIRGQPGDTLSLIPLNGDAFGITTHNLEYPLTDEALIAGPARGVSNVLTSPTAHVSLRTGILLAVHTPGRT